MFTIDEIIEAAKGTLVQGPAKGRVRSVCIDSRVCQKRRIVYCGQRRCF